jgi:DNA-binding beta-propeller fold protein YncE
VLLILTSVAASSAPAESPPPFLLEWGSSGHAEGQFDEAYGVAVDSAGNVHVADHENDRIQKFDSSGNFLRAWGWGVATGTYAFEICTSGCRYGLQGNNDGMFYLPRDVAVSPSGSVYVADYFNDRIQKFTSDGNYVAQWGSFCSVDSQGVDGCDGLFYRPVGVAVNSLGDVYVADMENCRIQKFDSDGNFITKWGELGVLPGLFQYPLSVAVDGSDNVYTVDGKRIQKFDSGGTYLKSWNGTGASQPFMPWALDVDTHGNVYVADTYNHRIQKFDNSGALLTMWGTMGAGQSQFLHPRGIAVDRAGNVFVGDTYNDRLQRFGGPWIGFFPGEHNLPSGH